MAVRHTRRAGRPVLDIKRAVTGVVVGLIAAVRQTRRASRDEMYPELL